MSPAAGMQSSPPIIPIQHGKTAAADLAALAETLARAFDEDAHINWIVRQDSQRNAALRKLFDLLLGDLGSQAEIFATADLKAAAIWFPPGSWKLGLAAQTRVALQFAGISGWKNIAVRAYGLNLMETRHPKTPHYFLQTIGVDPQAQGKGYGAALLETLLSRCDDARVSAYLETSNPGNLGFYEKYGFRITATAQLPQGPALYQMLRSQ